MSEQEFSELAAGHVLDALSPEDEREFAETLAAHPEWTAIVDADAATVAILAESVDEASAPRSLRRSLLEAIADAPQGDVHSEAAPHHRIQPAAGLAPLTEATPDTIVEPVAMPATRRRFGARGWFALAASLVILLVLGTGTVLVGQQLARPAAVVALDRIDSASDTQSATVQITGGGQATAHWSSQLGQAVLVSDGLPKLADGQTFELWFVRGDTPVPAGVFTASADGQATALLDGSVRPGDVIAVTVEQSGGSPTKLPTTSPIIAVSTKA